jgi:hypothetical protein
MNWTTLYITGRSDFREEVLKKLESSRLDFMPGYIESSSGTGIYDLLWIKENTPLREVKEAIGSKLIWKYRIRLYANLEDFIQSVKQPDSDQLSDDEASLMDAMRQSS